MVSLVACSVFPLRAFAALSMAALYFLPSLSFLPAAFFAAASAASFTSPLKSCWKVPTNLSFAGFEGGGGGVASAEVVAGGGVSATEPAGAPVSAGVAD